MSQWPLRVMIYGAGEAINGTGALSPQIQDQLKNLSAIATNRFVAAVAQLDSTNAATLRYVLDPQQKQPKISISDVNVGDPAALVDFSKWSAAICPAENSILVLSGHGAAWEDALVEQTLGASPESTRGLHALPKVAGALHHPRSIFGHDVNPVGSLTRAVLIDGSSRDFLSNSELGAACARISLLFERRIGILVFDACLMSSWEVLCELDDSVDVVVGSIDELSAAGIDLSSSVQEVSVNQGAFLASAVATLIVRNFRPAASFDSCVAIDLSRPAWCNAVSAFADFCSGLLTWVRGSQVNSSAVRVALDQASKSLVKFTGEGLADVGALRTAIEAIPNIPATVIRSLATAHNAVGDSVLAKSTGRDYLSATGISVFAPSSEPLYTINRPDYIRLRFSSRTGWSSVLDEIYGFSADARSIAVLSGERPGETTLTSDIDQFLVSLGGLGLESDDLKQVERAIREAVLRMLSTLDLLNGVHIGVPSSNTRNMFRTLKLPIDTAGLVVAASDSPVDASGSTERTKPVGSGDVPDSSIGSEFRVLLEGLKLNSLQTARIDAAVKAAVLDVLGRLDIQGVTHISDPSNAPETRGFLGDIPGRVLGLIMSTESGF